jgi:hypothetical protein
MSFLLAFVFVNASYYGIFQVVEDLMHVDDSQFFATIRNVYIGKIEILRSREGSTQIFGTL